MYQRQELTTISERYHQSHTFTNDVPKLLLLVLRCIALT